MEARGRSIANLGGLRAASDASRPADEGAARSGSDYIEKNCAAWERWAPAYAQLGREAWQEELFWGIWRVSEKELGLLDDLRVGADAVELGCGTAAFSAGLARLGLSPVAVDFSQAQLLTAARYQHEFNVPFELVLTNAESIAFDDESFDLAISDYGTSLWSDHRRWLPEAYRLLRRDGKLVFVTSSPLLMACTPFDGGPARDRLVREYAASEQVAFADDPAVEFHLTHGQWVRALRDAGFVVEDLIEVKPPPLARARFEFVSAEWARRWPSEDIWVVRRPN